MSLYVLFYPFSRIPSSIPNSQQLTLSEEYTEKLPKMCIRDRCPPAGIVLGILWFIISSSKRSFIPAKSYEEIHGTITPVDATRVVRPHYDYSIPFKYNPHYPEFRQGKLR